MAACSMGARAVNYQGSQASRRAEPPCRQNTPGTAYNVLRTAKACMQPHVRFSTRRQAPLLAAARQPSFTLRPPAQPLLLLPPAALGS